MSGNIYVLCTALLMAGLVSSCGSDNDTTSPIDTGENTAAGLPSSDDTTSGEVGESTLFDSENSETAVQDANAEVVGGSAETNPASQQNDGEQTATDQEPAVEQQQQTNLETDSVDPQPIVQQPVVQPAAEAQRANFGSARLLVDLVPNGDSYPAKFHRAGGKLYFLTVDTDPGFANCGSHWGNLGDDDKSIAFNLVATHPDTGVVGMNKQIMTLGDFAEDANNACAGFNGIVTQVYQQTWTTPQSATGEQQFVLHFDSYFLGPDQVWITDGSESNTRQLESGRIEENLIFEGNKVFFADSDGLSVSDTLSGERRKLFEAQGDWYPGIRRIVNSPARQATFEIEVGSNRYQIWTYDLDTDEWDKKFSIKPDDNIYDHRGTLLVDGQKLLSQGYDPIEFKSALGLSSNYGDVTSFEILTDSAPNITVAHSEDNNGRLLYSTTDYSVEPRVTSIWSYREEQIEKLFSMSEPDLLDRELIAGRDGRIYIAGIKSIRRSPESTNSFELWAYDPQTGQLVELSDNDWYAAKYDLPTTDESYVFRHLNTPDGLIFVNLKEDTGRELWFTDGSREGTRQLADINPGAGNSDPQHFYYTADAIYFSANDGVHGHEPWMIEISR